jgi:GDP-L-fucose synthase|tara:strand:+ start:1475 stop:2419 length:945 start_codon:yes stop_codon:yes gene_type:complete
MNKNSNIFLAGHKGLVGSAILRLLNNKGYKNIIVASKNQLDLLNQSKTFKFLKKKKIDVVIIAAAKVGGIKANNEYKAEFIYNNLQIQNNLIHGSYLAGIKNLLFLGSSCIYPKECKQPMKEDYLLSGNLEKTNEPYAVAKIAGLKMCESYNYQYKTNFKCLMPTNTYGPNDNYSLNNSHFLPALLRKVILAKRFKKKSITLWGTGTCKREAIHVDDVASAVLFFLKKKVPQTFLNIGSGEEMKISDYANLVKNIIYPNLHIKFNKDKSLDGVKRKLLDSNIAKSFGWKSKIKISKGIESTYKIIKNKKFNAES